MDNVKNEVIDVTTLSDEDILKIAEEVIVNEKIEKSMNECDCSIDKEEIKEEEKMEAKEEIKSEEKQEEPKAEEKK